MISVSLFNAVANQYQDVRKVNTVAGMRLISHQIEDQVINCGLPVDFYAGFQKLSRFPAELMRYNKLGATCRRVYVFGLPDATPPAIPGIEYIALDPSSPLCNEWFLVVDTPQFWTTLLTQELPGTDGAGGERRYDGLWSYDTQVVERASLLLSQAMGTLYQPVRERDHMQQAKHVAAIAGRMIGKLDKARIDGFRRKAQNNVLRRAAELVAQHRGTDLAQHIASLLISDFRATAAIVAQTDGNGRTTVTAAAGDASMPGRAVQQGDGPTGRALGQQAAVFAPDLRKQRERDPLLLSAQCVIAAPIIGAQGPLGVISVGIEETDRWGDEDAATIEALGRLVGQALSGGTVNAAANGASQEQLQRMEQAMAKLRWPISRMLDLQNKFEQAGALNAAQREVLMEFTVLSSSLNRALGGTRSE